jgi:predicted DNA-binding protein (MmcQ/YjbR family)
MDTEQIRLHALAKSGATEDFPFDETVLALRVGGKIFLLVPIDARPPQFNAKCDPELAQELRATWACVQPGYHMSKKHWNTVTVDGTAPAALVRAWIDHSYDLVFASLPAKTRREIAAGS